MGWVFVLIAVILFFLAGIGATVIPNSVTWGLFCLALGILIGNYSRPSVGGSPSVKFIWGTLMTAYFILLACFTPCVRDLDAKKFSVRERAQINLTQVMPLIWPLLEQREQHSPHEGQRRAKWLMDHYCDTYAPTIADRHRPFPCISGLFCTADRIDRMDVYRAQCQWRAAAVVVLKYEPKPGEYLSWVYVTDPGGGDYILTGPPEVLQEATRQLVIHLIRERQDPAPLLRSMRLEETRLYGLLKRLKERR